MTIASSNLPKIGVGVAKKNTNPTSTPAHLKSDSDFRIFKKTTSVPTPTKNMRLRFPTLTPQPWFKLKQLM